MEWAATRHPSQVLQCIYPKCICQCRAAAKCKCENMVYNNAGKVCKWNTMPCLSKRSHFGWVHSAYKWSVITPDFIIPAIQRLMQVPCRIPCHDWPSFPAFIHWLPSSNLLCYLFFTCTFIHLPIFNKSACRRSMLKFPVVKVCLLEAKVSGPGDGNVFGVIWCHHISRGRNVDS